MALLRHETSLPSEQKKAYRSNFVGPKVSGLASTSTAEVALPFEQKGGPVLLGLTLSTNLLAFRHVLSSGPTPQSIPRSDTARPVSI